MGSLNPIKKIADFFLSTRLKTNFFTFVLRLPLFIAGHILNILGKTLNKPKKIKSKIITSVQSVRFVMILLQNSGKKQTRATQLRFAEMQIL